MESMSHAYFNKKIYDWTLTMRPGVWYSIENIKMNKQEFINAITYLIACNEPLIFNNEMTAFKRTEKEIFKPVEINYERH